jgi:UDP-MurNAc hydroxylase
LKFTVIGHAGLLVESSGVKLVVDPWIIGTCYWRSWLNFPPALADRSLFADVDYIYLTHHHWDHFHGPSLRRMSPRATVLVPRAPTTHLVDSLRYFDFPAVREIAHAETVRLSPTLSVTSYHFGLAIDSVLVIEDGIHTLVDLNDCKITGRSLRQLTERHRHVDFLLRSHSSASPYPHCVEADDPADLQYRQDEDYLVEFRRSAELIRPTYAIPFASNHCYVHRDTVRFNASAVAPTAVKTHFDRESPLPAECVVMVAGDSWDPIAGFSLHPEEAGSDRAAAIAQARAALEDTLARQYQKEDQAVVTFDEFRGYFARLVASIPRPIRWIFKPIVVFSRPDDPTLWAVDFGTGAITKSQVLPPSWSLQFTVPPAVLEDCIERDMFSVFFPSKRMSIRLARGAAMDLFLFIEVVELYAIGFFPARRWFTPRFTGAWLRRWREVLHYARLAARMANNRAGAAGIRSAVPRVS